MSILRTAFLTFLLGFITFGSAGCLMQRTVEQGGSVVAEGYVVKTPVIEPVAPR